MYATNSLAKASLAGHEKIDVEHAMGMVEDLLHLTRSMVPYVTQGRTRADETKAERQEAVNEYHKYLKDTLGEEKYHEYVREQLGDEGYEQFMRSKK